MTKLFLIVIQQLIKKIIYFRKYHVASVMVIKAGGKHSSRKIICRGRTQCIKTTKVKIHIEANRLEGVTLSDVGGNSGVFFVFLFAVFLFKMHIYNFHN